MATLFSEELARLRNLERYARGGGQTPLHSAMDIGLSLTEFKAKMQDFARPNRFGIAIFPAPSLVGNNELFGNNIIFHTKGFNLPGRTISEFEVKHLGLTRKMPGEPTYENLTVTFWSEYSWDLRKGIEEWMQSIADTHTNVHTDSDVVLASTLKIYPLGRRGEHLAEYELHSVFPTVLGDIDMSHDSNDAVQEFQVTFSFSDWKSSGEK